MHVKAVLPKIDEPEDEPTGPRASACGACPRSHRSAPLAPRVLASRRRLPGACASGAACGTACGSGSPGTACVAVRYRLRSALTHTLILAPPDPSPLQSRARSGEGFMLPISKRSRELGTENAFVVLGEVAKLQAEGRDIASFCIGQPDFPTPDHIRFAGIRAITEGKTGYTPSPGDPASCARRSRGISRARAGSTSPPTTSSAVAAASRSSATRSSRSSIRGRGTRSSIPNPGFPDLRGSGQGARRRARAAPARESRAGSTSTSPTSRRSSTRRPGCSSCAARGTRRAIF